MKSLILALLLVITVAFNSFAFIPETSVDTGPCLDEDVWVYIKHNGFYEPPSTVIAHIPKHSLEGDFQNCPAEDTKVVGQGRTGVMLEQFLGMRIVTLKKGKLNDSKNFTTKSPKKMKVPANNINTWHVSK